MSGIRSIHRNATVKGSATGASAPIYVDSDDNKLKMIPAGSGTTEVDIVDVSSTQTLTNKTLTSPTVTGATLTTATLTAPVITTPTVTDLTEVVAATNVITAAETGSVFFLNSATEFASTLPAVAAGLHFTFIITAAPSGANYTIAAASGTPIIGQIATVDVNSATDPGFTATGVLTVTFVSAKSVVGDKAEFWCDGTNWFCYVQCSVFDAVTFS